MLNYFKINNLVLYRLTTKFGHVGPSCPRRTSKYIVYICVHVIEPEPRFTDQRCILSTYAAHCRSQLPIACLESLVETATPNYSAVFLLAEYDQHCDGGEERGFQALIRMERWVVWMLYLDVQSLMILHGGQKAVVAMVPASHPTTLSLLVRDLFQDAIRHCFLSWFSLHTSLLICFLGSGEISGEPEVWGAKTEPGQGHLCASEAAVVLILRVGLFGQDFFQKRSQIPPWGFALGTDALQMGRGWAPLQLGDGDLPLMSPLEPESCSVGRGGGWSSVLGQAGS